MNEVLIFALQVASLAIGAIAVVAFLAIFFRWLPRISPKKDQVFLGSAKDVFDEGRIYDVTLSSGQRFAALRFEGVVNADAETGWSLRHLAVLRRADGGKVILRLDSVRSFEEVVQTLSAGGQP
jgi:hypothetical protein